MSRTVDQEPRGAARHHGAYILERGVWHATCKACGWHVEDPDRRQVATLFRSHITAADRQRRAPPAASAP